MRAPRAVPVLLFCSVVAACERDADPVAPVARPSHDSGVTLGGGGKADSDSTSSTQSGDSLTVSTMDSGGTLGSGGK